MKKLSLIVMVASMNIAMSGSALADSHDSNKTIPTVERQALTPLNDVLDALEKKTNRRFAVAAGVQSDVSLGRLSVRELDAGDFMQVLALNDLASYDSGDITNIIPVTRVRSHPIPLVDGSEPNLHDAQWVSYLIASDIENPARLIPILRPLLPQYSHMSVHPEGRFLLVVDRWQNVQRIEAIVQELTLD